MSCVRDFSCCGGKEEAFQDSLLNTKEPDNVAETTYQFIDKPEPAAEPVGCCGKCCWKLWVTLLLLLVAAGAVFYFFAYKPHAIVDYDCDHDGTTECGKFDYERGVCVNLETCHSRYKFGDLTLDESCRCRRCEHLNFPATTAYGDANLIDPSSESCPYKGMYWGTFKVWGDYTDTCAPWTMPKDEDSLRRLLQYAKDHGYKVRISGAGHSAGGLVTEAHNQEVLVISMAEFTPSDEEWDFKFIKSADGTARARANAGWTFMNLFKQIRPQGYFLPATTAGWFFQLGGVVANGVHGGGYDKGHTYDYVTAMRVMGHDGAIRVVDDAQELKHWRGSLGLLGIILGVEFQLERRTAVQMDTVKKTLGSWSAESLWKFIKQDAEASLPHDIVPEGGQGSQKSWYAQFFLDFMGSSPATILAYRQKANESVDEGAAGRDSAMVTGEHYDELLQASVNVEGHGSMTWGQAARRDGAPSIGMPGIDITDVFDAVHWLPLAKTLSWASLLQISVYVKEYREKVNDGFFAYRVPPALAAAYYFPPEKAFEALDYLRSVMLKSTHSKDFMWNLPAEMRFIQVGDVSTLSPVEPGRYAAVEMLSFEDFAKNQQAWKKDFKKVEDYWINELGAKPHVAKLWGFTDVEGRVEPFHESFACGVFSPERKAAFSAYRESQDPENLFAAGLGMKMLAPCDVAV